MTHAKAIFFGEHSVVYGKKGITIPLLEMTVNVKLLKNKNNKQKRDETLKFIANKCNIDDNTEILIESKIPVGKGLGSSAALCVAICRAANVENIKEIADSCEKFIHGNPSGIDVNQVLNDYPLVFSKDAGAKKLDFKLDAFLLIIDTGVIGITKDTVANVRKNYKKNKKYIDILGDITEKVIPCLEKKQLEKIGQYMNLAHDILKKINVSHEKNDEVIEICNKNNALGSKLTGGGNGGCCISLCKSYESAKYIQKKLKEKGFLSWIVSV